jgi:hypothetical protein
LPTAQPTAHHVSAPTNSPCQAQQQHQRKEEELMSEPIKVPCFAIENLDGHTSEAGMPQHHRALIKPTPPKNIDDATPRSS